MNFLKLILPVILVGFFRVADARKVLLDFSTEHEAVEGKVLLKDIARIQAGPELYAQLANAEVGQMPQPGRERLLTISSLLRRAVYPYVNREDVEYEGSKVIKLKTLANSLDSERLQDTIQKVVMKRYESNVDSLAFVWSQKPSKLHIPTHGEWELKINYPKSFAGRGREFVNAEIVRDGMILDRTRVSFRISRFAKVAVAKKDIKRGQLIKNSDLEFTLKELTSYRYDTYRTFTELQGKEARRTIKSGRILDKRAVREEILVKRGEAIAIMMQLGNATLKVPGQALEKGIAGEKIRVRNVDSGKRLEAYVVAKGKVKVNK